jgi:Uncharacterized protein conserved in bacteria
VKKTVSGALGVVGLALLVLAGCAANTPSPGGGGSADAGGSLSTTSTSVGDIIVDGTGMTVYVYDQDTANSGKSACTGSCATQWPAVKTTKATPTVAGITGTVGTIDAVGGGKQVTINGLPLYTYAGDASAGDLTGQGFGGIWWVVDPAGTKITEMVTNDRGY